MIGANCTISSRAKSSKSELVRQFGRKKKRKSKKLKENDLSIPSKNRDKPKGFGCKQSKQ